MMRKLILSLAAVGFALSAAPAMADDRRDDRREWREDRREWRQDRREERREWRQERREDRRDYRQARYDDRGRYYEPRRLSRNDRVWRGNDGRYRCQRENGTTGLIIGAAGGALLGREVDGGRDRTLGTILGGALGGLLGREIDLSDAKCQ